MARTDNLTNFLSDIAGAIKEKTGDQTAIPASEFDAKIKSIETKGTYQKKQLSIENNGNYSVSADEGYDAVEQLDISVDVAANLQEKNITENGNYSPDEGYTGFSSVNVNVPTQEIKNQNKTITKNGSYTADKGYTGLGTVLVNVPQEGGSGDVKLFETVEQMQADPSAKEGDLAVVYRSEIQNWNGEGTITGANFPETVVLPEAFSDYSNISLRSDEGMFDCYGNLSPERFSMSAYSESGEFSIRYTSSDGLTYTRTDGGEEYIDFGCEVYNGREWNDALGYFFQTGGMYFEGLYKYGTYKLDGTYKYMLNTSDLTASELPFKLPDIDTYTRVNELIGSDNCTQYNELVIAVHTYHLHSSGLYNVIDTCTVYQTWGGYLPNLVLYNNNLYVNASTRTTTDYPSYIVKDEYDFSLDNPLVSTTNRSISESTSPDWTSNLLFASYNKSRARGIPISGKYALCLDSSNAVDYSVYNTVPKTTSIEVDNTITIKSAEAILMSCDYLVAPTQLTLSSSNQLLLGVKGYGKNGFVTGDGTVLDNFTLYELINSNIGEPYDIKTLHNSKIIYKNGRNNYNKTLLKRKTFDGTGICMFEKLNPLENAIGRPNTFVKYKYGYVLIKVNSAYSAFTFVYYDNDFNYRHTQTVSISKKVHIDGRVVNWYEDDTGLYCLLSPPSSATDIGMLHILDTTATIKLNTVTGTYNFTWGIVTPDHCGIFVSGTYSSSKYTLYINKYDYSANTVTKITTLSSVSLSNARVSFAEDVDNIYVCIGNSSYTASSTYQNCKVYVISKSTYTVTKTLDTGSKYAVFTSASDTAPCLVITDNTGNATVNLMINGNLEYQHNIAIPTIAFYYWSKYISNKQSLYLAGGGYGFSYVNICTPTENNLVLPNIEWWSDTGDTYSYDLFSSAQPYNITENTIDVYTFTSTADFYRIHVDLALDTTNTNEGEFILPISDKTKSYMAYAYFGYICDNNPDVIVGDEDK